MGGLGIFGRVGTPGSAPSEGAAGLGFIGGFVGLVRSEIEMVSELLIPRSSEMEYGVRVMVRSSSVGVSWRVKEPAPSLISTKPRTRLSVVRSALLPSDLNDTTTALSDCGEALSSETVVRVRG